MTADEPEPSLSPDAECVEGRVGVFGFDAQRDHAVALDTLCRIAVAVLAGEQIGAGRVDLHLVDIETITELNAEHMGATGPTDVLSFPLDADPFAPPNDDLTMLGDLVLCPTVAIAQAPDHAGSVAAELALLVIHGVLHLLGHDHVETAETLTMQARERHHLAQLGFEHPVAVEPEESRQ